MSITAPVQAGLKIAKSGRRRAAGLAIALMAPALLVLAGPTPPAASVLPPQCVTQANGVDIVCTFTGGPGASWTFTAPNGATSSRFRAVGEPGRQSDAGVPGGRSRFVDTVTSTTPGESIQVRLLDDGGFAGDSAAGAGGGSALVSRNGAPYMQAAGGGGAGASASNGAPGGVGGDAHGFGGSGTDANADGGAPGSSGSHGPGGAGACVPFLGCNPPGSSGTGTRGGTGGHADSSGGGGGGGWRTGGGGGSGWHDFGYSAGGGGGGFSLVPTGSASGFASPSESRRVVITFFRARLVASPDPVDFGNVTVGTLSPTQNVTVRNNGTAPLTVTGSSLSSSNFQKPTDNCAGVTLPPGATCTIGVRFAPQLMGTANAALTISSNTMDGSDNVVQLTGTGVQPIATITPSNLDFGPVTPDTQSPPQTVTVMNTGTANLVISSVAMLGPNPSEFLLLHTNCNGANLPPNGQCTAEVAFKPATTGNRTALLRFVDNAPGSPREIPLSGVGALPTAALAPASVDFGQVEIGGNTGPFPVTISNTGNVPLNVSAIGVDGANASDFAVDPGGCLATIEVDSSCVVHVSFEPQRRGARTAVLSVASNASGSPHEVSLQGSGVSIADLLIRGPGNAFTAGDGSMVTLAVSAGGTATYRIKVVNTGDLTRAFEIGLEQDLAASAPKVTTSTGAALPTNAEGNYVTKSLAPGGSVIYLVKVKVAAPGQVTSGVDVHLLADNGASFDFARTETNVKAPTKGTDAFGLFAKAGSQPYVGGSVDDQTTTAAAVGLGSSTKYTVKLRNDSAAATSMLYRMSSAANACWTMKATIKVGTKTVDITADAIGNGFQTKVLPAGGSMNVTVTLKRVANGCGSVSWQAASYDGGILQHFSHLLANPKV